MLNRRFLRVKVLQALYGYFSGSYDDIAKGEREMLRNIEKMERLYLYLFELILEIWDVAKKEIEQNRAKRLPTEEDLNPNLRFAENRFLQILDDNTELRKRREAAKVHWKDEFEAVRKLWRKIKSSEEYGQYMHRRDNDFQMDKDFVLHLYETYLQDAEFGRHMLEEESIYWSVDLEIAHLAMYKTLNSVQAKTQAHYNFLSDIYRGPKDDERFIKELFRKTVLNSEEYETLVGERAKNWESDRIAFIDMIIMKMALCEFEFMEEIPTKVTINEYIELSKSFSSQNSRSFVNGVLDRLLEQFRKDGRVKKMGRGLIE